MVEDFHLAAAGLSMVQHGIDDGLAQDLRAGMQGQAGLLDGFFLRVERAGTGCRGGLTGYELRGVSSWLAFIDCSTR